MIITECAEASVVAYFRKMYRALRKIGTWDNKPVNSTVITTDVIKEYFEKVSETRHERDPNEMEEVLSGVRDLRNDQAVEANTMLNGA